jgi:hypothetical protein
VTAGAVMPAPAARRGPALLCIAAAFPLIGAGLAALGLVVGWLIGASPFWAVANLTLSEAVVTRDAGEVVRLIVYEHADPDQPWPVRPGLAPGAPAVMTPLTAAVITRRLEMVRLLVHRGAHLPTGVARDRLICDAAAAGGTDIVEFLMADGAGDPRGRCTSFVSSVD